MSKIFLAKSKSINETIQEHTDKLLVRLKRLKALYPNINVDWDILYLACVYHDIGKINSCFQERLIKCIKKLLPEEFYHNYLSPAMLPIRYLEDTYNEDFLLILYQCIYYHHNRRELADFERMQIFINNDLAEQFKLFQYDKLIPVDEGVNDSYSWYVDRRIGCDKELDYLLNRYIMVKGLLHKLDYSASANIDVEIENSGLTKSVINAMTTEGYSLNNLQDYMLKHQDENNIIVASTGIGKTEASLLWIGDNKGFFTLPLKTCINAMYDRIVRTEKGCIGFNKSETALLHSDSISELLARNTYSDGYEEFESYKKAKQFSYPLTVCTLDQLIDFIFKYNGYELKLATLAYSKLVIDEIQTYSPELLGYLLVALKNIYEIGGNFSIVTATLPSILLDFLDELDVKYNLPKEPFVKKDYKTGKEQIRHKIKLKNKTLNATDILNSDYKDKKVLVIANTVRASVTLYNTLKSKLPKDYNINLLHSKFIKRDRKIKEAQILNMGKTSTSKNCIWVTTQIAEISLNIDYDNLHTELSDVSSLFQRMGRIFRDRILELGAPPNVIVYCGDENELPSGIKKKKRSVYDYDIFSLSKKYLKDYDGKILCETDKMNMMKDIYSKENIENTQYYKDIKNAIDFAETIEPYSLSRGDERLRDIDTKTFIPLSVYSDNKAEIESLRKIINDSSKDNKERQLAKAVIKEYSVSTPWYETTDKKRVDTLKLGKYEELEILDFPYSYELGLIYE